MAVVRRPGQRYPLYRYPEQCYSKRGSQTSSSRTTWEHIKTQILRSYPKPTEPKSLGWEPSSLHV